MMPSNKYGEIRIPNSKQIEEKVTQKKMAGTSRPMIPTISECRKAKLVLYSLKLELIIKTTWFNCFNKISIHNSILLDENIFI